MSTIVIVVVFLLGWKVFTWDLDRSMENYDLSKVDLEKIRQDKECNFLSLYDVKQNIVNGKYDRNRPGKG